MEIVIVEIMYQCLQKAYILTAFQWHALMAGNEQTF